MKDKHSESRFIKVILFVFALSLTTVSCKKENVSPVVKTISTGEGEGETNQSTSQSSQSSQTGGG